MPFPFLIAAIIATKAASATADIFGQRKQAKYYETEADMEAELFGKNAALADEQATDALARGREAELRQRVHSRLLTGSQQAGFAGQGVTLGVGSAAQVVASDRALGEFDALMIRENAAREAMGFTKEAEIYRGRAALTRTAGKNRARATRNQAYGSLANFGGDMFQLYQTGRRP